MSCSRSPLLAGLALALALAPVACAPPTPVEPPRPSAASSAPEPPPGAAPTASTPTAPSARQPLFEPDREGSELWPTGDAATLGFDEDALSDLVAEAARTKSDALLIIKDGKRVVERYFGKPARPIATMSVTKSIVSLAVGLLIDEGKIRSVDAPLSTWFPSWTQGRKAKVTLRHVLTQTSGLKHEQGTRVLNQHDDRLKFVIDSPVVEEPGARFSYNNEATLLLSGIIRAAAGKDVDAYLKDKLFEPLGITAWSWRRDPAGNALTHAGLSLSARDLAKIGQLMLDGGRWQGKQVVSEPWITAATSPSPRADHYGYLWWIRYDDVKLVLTQERYAALGRAGFQAAGKLQPLVDQPRFGPLFWMELGSLLSHPARVELARLVEGGLVLFDKRRGDPIAFAADGWLGQALIVSRPYRLVVVRQHAKPPDRDVDDAYNQLHGFFALGAMLKGALAPARSRR